MHTALPDADGLEIRIGDINARERSYPAAAGGAAAALPG
jgi:hypothetical protein